MNQTAPNKTLVLWVIWAAMLAALFKFQFFLGGGLPSGEDDGMADLPFLAMAIGALLASTAIRWIVLPRQKSEDAVLVTMIIGIALAESAQFFQLFLIGDAYPQTQLTIFVFAVLGVAQFVPIYAGKLQTGTGRNS